MEDLHIAIVGCGTIGSNLAIELAKNKIKKISIFDCDIVTFKNNEDLDPYNNIHKNFYKVDVLSYLIKKNSDNLIEVKPYRVLINEALSENYFIIDCRDRKNYIRANLEISLDGNILQLNSSSNYNKEINRSQKYHFEKTKLGLCVAIKKIIQYLKNKEYEYKEFRDYDLEKDKFHIINI